VGVIAGNLRLVVVVIGFGASVGLEEQQLLLACGPVSAVRTPTLPAAEVTGW
jgi:hypothetical protein